MKNASRPSPFARPARILAATAAVLCGLLGAGAAAPPQARAQAGSLDPNFNPGAGAIAFPNPAAPNSAAFSAFPGQVYATAVDPSGNALVGGNFLNVGDLRRNFQARLDVNGGFDSAYNAGLGFDNLVRAILVQPDGSAFVGGFFSSYNGQPANSLVRLTPTGTIDNTFDSALTGSGTAAARTNSRLAFNGSVRAIATQSINGTNFVVVGGSFTTITTLSDSPPSPPTSTTSPLNRIARLTASGSVDPTFNASGSGADDAIEALAVQNDGKILVGGAFNVFNGAPRRSLVRLNADGSLDAAFNVGAGFDGRVRAIAVQANGQILVGGDFTTVSGIARRGIVRLNSNDGSLDAAFNANGPGTDGAVRALAVNAAGQVYLGGDFTAYNGLGRNRVARLNADGSLDGSFNPGAGADGPVRSLALNAAGQVYLGGDFTAYNGALRVSFTRVNADGSPDAGYALPPSGFGFRAVEVDALAVTSNGKILAGGNFTALSGLDRLGVDRLNADGTSDANFNPLLGTDFNVTRAVAAQLTQPALTGTPATSHGGDDNAFVGGDFLASIPNSSGASRSLTRLARLLPNGQLDADASGVPTFSGPDGTVRALIQQTVTSPTTNQPVPYLLIGGDFSSYKGTPRAGVARVFAYSTDPTTSQPRDARGSSITAGQLDTTFNPGTGGNSSVRALAVQPGDNRVLVGGDFTNFNGVARNFLTRLNVDGSLDASFNPGTGPDRAVEAIAAQTANPAQTSNNGQILNGQFYIGGGFVNVGGAARPGVARLNPGGTLDLTFNANLPAGVVVHALLVQPDGKVIIGGDFSSVGGASRNNLARLNVDGSLDFSFNPGTGANGSVRALALKNNGRVIIGGSFSAVNDQPRARLAQINGDQVPGAFQFSDFTFTASQTAGQVTITVVRTGGAAGDATVNFATVDGSARAGVDYQPTSGTLTFLSGVQTPQTFTVTLLTPPNPAPNRTLQLVLSSPTGDTALGNPSTATLVISNAAPGVLQFSNANTGTDFSVREDAGSVAIVVTRTNGSAGQVSVNYRTFDEQNAAVASRYQPVSGTLIFEDGDTAPKVFRVPIINNSLVDGNATVRLLLTSPTSSPTVPGGSATANLTIVDDDGPPATQATVFQFAQPVFSVFETAGTATITVTRTGGRDSGGSAGQVSVRYFVTDATARAGVNFANTLNNPTSGTLTWAANDFTPKTFSITILRDNQATGDLALQVELASPTPLSTPPDPVTGAPGRIILGPDGQPLVPATLGQPNQATLTIVDADQPAELQFSAPTYLFSENAGAAVVNVTRTGGTGTAVAVAYGTQDGTARAGVRYQAVNGTLSWAAGDASPKSIVIPLINDTNLQPDQTLNVFLGQVQGNAILGGQGRATVTIRDDDGGFGLPAVAIAATVPQASTGGGVRGIFTVTRANAAPSGDLLVNYSVRGSAINGTDYKLLSGQVLIPAGRDSALVKVKALRTGSGTGVVKLIVRGGDGYSIGAPDRAKVGIVP